MKFRSVGLAGVAFALLASFLSAIPAARDTLAPLPAGTVHLDGFLGGAIDASRVGGLKAQNVEEVLRPFRERKDVNEWRSEFWGKWITAAIPAWRYSGDPQLRTLIAQTVTGLIATQTADGYIGAYPDGGHLQRWDIWGRKYTLLGLLAWHEATGDEAVLAAARRQADFLLSEVGPGKASPFTRDMWNGMASGSILEPMVLLYRRTGDPRYLDFANYLVQSWAHPDGPDLLNKALAGTPVYDMFPKPKPVVKEYGDGGKSKAYEMMSNYEGLLELYRTTGEPRYREAVQKVYAAIRDREITVIGSGSDWERWCDGRGRQTEQWAKGMETCVTATWIKLSAQMLRLSGDPACADEIERAACNALLGAEAPDGSWWCHHSPLAGVKERAPEQCNLHQNCCVASGPRGLVVLPAVAVMNRADGPVINLYGPSQATVPLADGGRVELVQATDYPANGVVEIRVKPDQPRTFALSLRIPAWSTRTNVTVNGEVRPEITAGTYASLLRRWQTGDLVRIDFDFTPRVMAAPGDPHYVAVARGPLVLARDRRLDSSDIDEPVGLRAGETIELLPMAAPSGIRQAFVVAGKGLRLCDFSSVGNTWAEDSRYRVWMPMSGEIVAAGTGH